MFFTKKVIEKVVTLRMVVGDLIFNQNINMALSPYGLNLKDLKMRLDSLIDNLPKGIYLYFFFILYKNGTYDIFLRGPTLSSIISTSLVDLFSLDENAIEKCSVTFNDMFYFSK